MEAEQKAKELVDKMKLCLFSDGDYDAKQCASLHVNEILKSGLLVSQPDINKKNNVKPNSSHKEYWQELKNEILKL
jgi:hypothetical protein